jgi:hypothetical protein
MPQLNVPFGAILAQPGMAFDAELSNRDVVSVVAAQNTPFGSYVELRSGYASLAYPLQDSGTTTTFLPESLGIAMFDPLGVEQSYSTFAVPATSSGSSAVGWLKGQKIPIMRRGRIWVLADGGGTPLNYGAINVWHSSDASHLQGVFTFTAPSAVVGAEIDVAPSCVIWNPDGLSASQLVQVDPFNNTFKIYPVGINLT